MGELEGRPIGRLCGCRCPAARECDETPAWSPGVAVEPPKPSRVRGPTCQGTCHQIQSLVPSGTEDRKTSGTQSQAPLFRTRTFPPLAVAGESAGTLRHMTALPDRLGRGVLHIKERKPPRFGARRDKAMPEMVAAIVLAGLGLATAGVNLAVAAIELRKQRNRTPRRRCREHRRGHTSRALPQGASCMSKPLGWTGPLNNTLPVCHGEGFYASRQFIDGACSCSRQRHRRQFPEPPARAVSAAACSGHPCLAP